MTKHKNLRLLANKLGMSEKGTKKLIEETQKYIRDPKASVLEIIDAINYYPEITKNPRGIALAVNSMCRRKKGTALRSSKLRGAASHPALNTPNAKPTGKRGVRRKSSVDKSSAKPTGKRGVRRKSYVDKSRVGLDEIRKCPHGVPVTQICAICDPKRFREMTGI